MTVFKGLSENTTKRITNFLTSITMTQKGFKSRSDNAKPADINVHFNRKQICTDLNANYTSNEFIRQFFLLINGRLDPSFLSVFFFQFSNENITENPQLSSVFDIKRTLKVAKERVV